MTGVDITFLVTGVVLALVTGALTGWAIQIKWEHGRAFQRMAAKAMALWIGFAVVRVVIGGIGHFSGATLTAGGGSILLTVGPNLLVQSGAVALRTSKQPVPGRRFH